MEYVIGGIIGLMVGWCLGYLVRKEKESDNSLKELSEINKEIKKNLNDAREIVTEIKENGQ